MCLFFWHPNHWNNEHQAPCYLYQPLVTSQFHHFSPLRQNKSRAFTKDPHKSTHHGVWMSLPLATRMPLEKHFCILGLNIETLRKLWHPLTFAQPNANRDTRLRCQRQFQSQWTVLTGNKHLRQKTHGLPTRNINSGHLFLRDQNHRSRFSRCRKMM